MNQHSIKKIIVVTSYFYPKIGGVENYAYLLAKNLHASGKYSVSIITSDYLGKGYSKESIDDMTIYRLPSSFNVSNTPVNLMWYWKINDIFKDEEPDLVHVHAPVVFMPDIAAVAAKNVPVVVTYHAGSMLKNKWLADIFIGMYEKIFLPLLFRRAGKIITISDKILREKFPEFVNKMTFIPTGVDLGRFKKTPIPSDTEVVTYVGRIEHNSSWKGIGDLLEAFKLVLLSCPHAQLELIGGGDAIAHYTEKAKELHILDHIKFYGPLTGVDLVNAYERSRVVVLPSTSDSEAFSITLVEAMASGRPIIATNIGGNPQVVEDGKNGYLVSPKDPESLSTAIIKMITDKKTAMNMGDYGSARAQEFSWDIRARQYGDVFDSLLY